MKSATVRDQLLAFFTEGDSMVMGVVRNVRENPFSVTARLSSDKLGRVVQAESLLEYEFLNILDFDPRVEKYAEQCLVIPWRDSAGRRRRYHPDVLVKFHQWAMETDPRLGATAYEVKPKELLRGQWPEVKLKCKAAIGALKPAGVRFRLITNAQIQPQFSANVRFLLNYKIQKFRDEKTVWAIEMDAWLLSVVRSLDAPTTPQAILDSFAGTFDLKARLIPRIWYFLATCVLDADLIEPLTMSTPVWPGQHHRVHGPRFPVPMWRQRNHDWYR